MRAKPRASTLRVQRYFCVDRTARTRGLQSDRAQLQRIEFTRVGAGGKRLAVTPLNRLGRDVPDHRGALLQLLHHSLGSLRGSHASGESHARTASYVGEADRCRVGHHRAHARGRDAKHFGHHHANGSTGATNVRAAGRGGHRTILIDVHLRRQLTANVEPEAARKPPAMTRLHCRLPMWMVLYRLQQGLEADVLVAGAVVGLRTVACPFFSRSLSGSMSNLRARSSSRLSTAKDVIGAPGARYAAVFGRLLTTS